MTATYVLRMKPESCTPSNRTIPGRSPTITWEGAFGRALGRASRATDADLRRASASARDEESLETAERHEDEQVSRT